MSDELAVLDQAVVDHLDGVSVGGWPRPVGYCEIPEGGDWQGEPGASPFQPYLQVWPYPAGYGPMMSSSYAFTDGEMQIKSVSTTAADARRGADAARARMLDVPLDVPGRHVIDVRPVSSSGPTRDDDVVPPLFYAVEVFAIETA